MVVQSATNPVDVNQRQLFHCKIDNDLDRQMTDKIVKNVNFDALLEHLFPEDKLPAPVDDIIMGLRDDLPDVVADKENITVTGKGKGRAKSSKYKKARMSEYSLLLRY